MNKYFGMASLLVILFLLTPTAPQSQDTLKDGLTIYTSSWDDMNLDTGYAIHKWVYSSADDLWNWEEQFLAEPLIQGFEDVVFDMGMEMFYLSGRPDLYSIMTVSKGPNHFPSAGTEFQLRRLNENNEWVLVQPALITTPADMSPLGIEVYMDGGDFHLAWIEDNDEPGPKSLVCEIFDQAYTVNTDGTLSPKSDKALIYTQKLSWGDDSSGLGGVTGLTRADYDKDGDFDFIVGNMFYGESPAAVAIQMIECTAPGTYAKQLKELWYGTPGHGAEGVDACDIDGDSNLDLIITSGSAYPWDVVIWLEKQGNELVELLEVLRSSEVIKEYDPNRSVSHVFGLSIPDTFATEIRDWEIME